MSLFYKLAYAIGFTPWEETPTLPISRQIASFLDLEERERDSDAPRSALDVGCGSGIWTLRLASHGWQTTGVDFVPKAVRRARQRLEQAGVEARVVEGDMTELSRAEVGSDFDFVLDLGAIHGLTDTQRSAAGREITAVTAPHATALVLAFTPALRGPLPRGMNREQLEQAFGAWQVVDEVAAIVEGAPAFVQRAAPTFYRLRRR